MFDDIRRTKDIEAVIDTCDFVIHLAANADVRRSIASPDEYWENNVEPTTVIQNRCHANNTPLLYASSSCTENVFIISSSSSLDNFLFVTISFCLLIIFLF